MCIDGYGLDFNSNCIPCIDKHCNKCSYSDYCLKCDDGYYLDTFDNGQKICKKCSDHCNNCTNSTACLECDYGYTINNYGQCVFDSKNNARSLSASMSIVWTYVRSVSMSASYVKSNVISFTYFDNTYIGYNAESYFVVYLPYIIYYLSPSYSNIIILIDTNIRKKE